MSSAVKITVIGDEKVGKTSLITTAATESFPEQPPPLLPPTRLPPETTTEHLPILVTDTSSRPEDRQALETAVTQADVIVLLFDTGEQQTAGTASLSPCSTRHAFQLARAQVSTCWPKQLWTAAADACLSAKFCSHSNQGLHAEAAEL